MGNIRSTYVKRIALELVQKYPSVFNDDFENNKMLVSKLTNVESTTLRNRVAGYVTTYWQNLER
ncbi:MAG: 30S ribosomal protein S17e [Euryarchaeota archaeon]|nr:30S ribosomal protein S17e [Euryarchaeota archaeon]